MSSLWQTLVGQCTVPLDAVVSPTEDTVNEHFLTEHIPDRPMRSIIDLREVDKAIQYQAELKMQQSVASVDDQAYVEPSPAWEVESNAFETESNLPARTEITTFSTVTRVAGNRERYAPKKRKSKRRLDDSTQDALPPHPRSIAREDAASPDCSFASFRSAESGPQHKRPSSSSSSSSPPSVSQVGCLLGCVAPEPVFLPILQLRMRCHMVDFYRKEFLTMFPDSTLPVGMSRQSIAPQLIRSLSGSSSWEERHGSVFELDYGMEVESSPIRMLVDRSAFMDLALTGSLGLTEQQQQGFSPASSAGSRSSHSKSPTHYKVLLNRRSGVPLAVCALKSPYGPPVVRVYAIKQRVFGQRPAANTAALGLNWTEAYPLFAWAEITAEGEFPNQVEYSFYMATGSDGRFEQEPSYVAKHNKPGSPDISVSGRTEWEPHYQGCAHLTIQNEGDDHFFSLSLSKGIDPALFICFAAIADESMEKTMRLHCELSNRRRASRSRRAQ